MSVIGAIRFDHADLELFAEASFDANPLHLSEGYSRRTAYGEPVVFGVLGALAAFGRLPASEVRELSSVSLSFRQPLFTATDYTVEESRSTPDRARLTVRDGGRVMLTASFQFLEAGGDDDPVEIAGFAPRSSPVAGPFEHPATGSGVSGEYSPAATPFHSLLERWGLAGKGASGVQIAALLWSSYLIGMELPGERALYSQLKLDFARDRRRAGGRLEYAAEVAGFDGRVDLLEISARIERGGRPFATAELKSYVRRDVPTLSRTALAAGLAPSDALKDKVAIVTGGSRGLGAALVGVLASQGCHVVLNYRSGRAEADRICTEFEDVSGSITLVQADVSDAADCARLLREVLDRFGAVDFLICNAAPPVRGIGFAPGSVDRIRRYVAESLTLVALPLATFVDSLEARQGWSVLISSAFCSVTDEGFPPDLHHYVSAKSSVEGIVRSVACQYSKIRHLIVRPPRLLTTMTNTPTGREGALSVEGVAATVVQRLCRPRPESRVEVLEGFVA